MVKNVRSDEERIALAGEIALRVVSDWEAVNADRSLATEIDLWNEDLARLTDELPPMPADPRIWQRVMASLEPDTKTGTVELAQAGMIGATSARLVRILQSVFFWRCAAAFGFAAAIASSTALLDVSYMKRVMPTVHEAPSRAEPTILVSSLLPRDGAPLYVATFESFRRTLVVVPVDTKARPRGVLRFWIVPNESETPIAIGDLEPRNGPQALPVSSDLVDIFAASAALVITLEPSKKLELDEHGPVIAHGHFEAL